MKINFFFHFPSSPIFIHSLGKRNLPGKKAGSVFLKAQQAVDFPKKELNLVKSSFLRNVFVVLRTSQERRQLSSPPSASSSREEENRTALFRRLWRRRKKVFSFNLGGEGGGRGGGGGGVRKSFFNARESDRVCWCSITTPTH